MSDGQLVINATTFRTLHFKVQKLEQDGIAILFWHVGRAENKEPDALANLALDEAE
jgi:hypothetical protein